MQTELNKLAETYDIHNQMINYQHEKLYMKLKKHFIIVYALIFILGCGLAVNFVRLKAATYFTYFMNRQAAEILTDSKIYWDTGIKHIVVIKDGEKINAGVREQQIQKMTLKQKYNNLIRAIGLFFVY